jgi:hypothetical protein
VPPFNCINVTGEIDVFQHMCMLPLSMQAAYMVLAFLRTPLSVLSFGDERTAVERKIKHYLHMKIGDQVKLKKKCSPIIKPVVGVRLSIKF